MSCITNYIGLKNCTLEDPKSLRYVNSLPGISTELADKIANSEQITFAKVWEDVQERAYLRLRNDVVNMLADEVKFNTVVYQTRKLLKAQRNANVITASANYNGVYIMLPESKYSELRLKEIYVYSDTAVTTVLKVWDVNDGVELYSKEITLIVGLNTIDISQNFDLKYRVQEYFIGVDSSGFNSIETVNDYYYWYSADMACANSSRLYYSARGYFQLYPASIAIGDDINNDNLVKGVGKGVVIGADILCSIDQFICDNLYHLEEPLLYLLGSELLMEKLNSSLGTTRLNYFNSSNKEQTEKTMLDYDFKYTDRLKKKVKAIPINGESLCFSCEEEARVSYKGMLP